MKRTYFLAVTLFMIMALLLSGCSAGGKTGINGTSTACSGNCSEVAPYVVKAAFEGGEATLELKHDPLVTEMLSRIPISVPFQDRNGIMKVAVFSPSLVTGRAADGLTPAIGDIALNVKTGEVIVYCRDGAYSPDLVLMGHVTSGLDKIFAKTGSFEVYVVRAGVRS